MIIGIASLGAKLTTLSVTQSFLRQGLAYNIDRAVCI
jgi:hypothetical protein